MDDIYLKVSQDGDSICVLCGENLSEGIAGFGNTVADALRDFADAWERENG